MTFIVERASMFNKEKPHQNAVKKKINGEYYWTMKFTSLKSVIDFCSSEKHELIIGQEKCGTKDGFTDFLVPKITIYDDYIE